MRKMKIDISPGEFTSETAARAKEGDILFLKAGVHRILSPVTIRQKEDLTILGEEGAVLTGARELSLRWERWKGDIFRAKAEKNLDIQALVVNGEEYIMARYPNYKQGEILGGYAGDALSQERVRRWKNPAGGYVRGLHDHEWGGNSYVIEGLADDSTPILRWIGDNNRGSGLHPEFIMVENILEELDAWKEWYYDRRDGFLYVMFPEDVDPDRAAVEAVLCGELIRLQDCGNVRLENLKIRNTKRMMFCSDYVKVSRSDWAIAENGAVFLENCEDISIRGCEFHHVGGNCIFIRRRNRRIAVENCDFISCGASGVCAFGNQECIRDLSVWENCRTEISDWTPGPVGDDFPVDIAIRGCYFTDLGRFEKQSAPVTISASSRVTVQGCTIHDLPRAGINICEGAFGGHRILDNAIFDTVKETGDHGPFNSWGRDRFWSLGGYDTGGHNGAEKRKAALLDAVETTVISHNLIVGNRGFGIDLDDGSSNYLIANNYCVGVGIKLREGFLRTVRNNMILGAPLDLHCTYAENGDVIENNIVASGRPLCIIAQNPGYTTVFRNNLFVGGKDSFREEDLFLRFRNYTCPAGDADALGMKPKEIWFEPFSMNFGCPDRPLPDLELREESDKGIWKAHGAKVSGVDDAVRSMGGLADYGGVFVEEIETSCRLYLLGARKDDILLEINGKKLEGPDEFAAIAGEISSVKAVRAQKQLDFILDILE